MNIGYYELISSYDSQYSSLALINFVTLSPAGLFYVSNLLENSSKTQYSPEIFQVDVTPYPLATGSALWCPFGYFLELLYFRIAGKFSIKPILVENFAGVLLLVIAPDLARVLPNWRDPEAWLLRRLGTFRLNVRWSKLVFETILRIDWDNISPMYAP